MSWLVLILVGAAAALFIRALRAQEPRSDFLERFDFDEAKQQES